MSYRRYAPAWIVASTLLLLVAIAPSRGTQQTAGSAFAPFEASLGTEALAPTSDPGSDVADTAGTDPAGSGPAGTTDGTGTAGSGTPTGTSSPGTAAAQGGGTTGNGTAGAPPTGDTSHCQDGRQFSLAGFIAAPPCQAAFAGGDNGGATYRGVTPDTVQVVYYRVKPNAAVEGALSSTGIQPTAAELRDFLDAAAVFINKRYELWGRQVKIDIYQSPSCQSSPPSDDCFRQDARAVVAQFSPFAVIFPQNATSAGFHDELSKAGVVNFGGVGLPGSFNTSRRPFRYDHSMDGDTQAVLAGEFYCKRMANQNAVLAGDAALRSTPRKALILTPDAEGAVATAQRLQATINSCDRGGGATIKTYAQDTSQAASQSTTLASQAKQSGVTTFLWITDPVAPIFFTPAMTSQNYFPENVTVGSNFLDYDPLGQLYDQQQWANAFGLGNLAQSQDPQQLDSAAAYRDGGGTGNLYISADGAMGYLSILAAGIQQSGARLDPGTFERGVLTLPAYGGDPLHSLIAFGSGDYTGQSDVRLTYWNPAATSPTNGKRGAYQPLDNGQRYAAGTFPTGALSVPRAS